MTFRERIHNTFNKKQIDKIVWQPRIYYWYKWHKAYKTLPEKYRGMSMLEVYDDLRISPRYFPEVLDIQPIEEQHSAEVKIVETLGNEKSTVVIRTPKGELVKELDLPIAEGWRLLTYPIKNVDDIEKAIWLYENTTFVFVKERFKQAREIFGDRGEPQFYVPRSGYQALAIELMGLENLIYALNDYPEKVERLMSAIDDSYDVLFEGIVSSAVVKILNFGENIDANLTPPSYFEKYCLPFYEKRTRQLQKAGIFSHIHIDGSCKPLLKYLRHLPFDGIEALTPLPQGDVTLEELREAIGDKILLDGIPAILFLPQYSYKDLEDCVLKALELFSPNLILGASDEVPPPGEIEKVKFVTEIVDNYVVSK